MEKVPSIQEKVEKYKNGQGNYLFPSPNIDPKKKLTPQYAKQVCEAIFSTYLGDKCAIPYTMLDYFNIARQYANGQQDCNQYFEQLGISNVNSTVTVTNDVLDKTINNRVSKNKGYGNLNKQIFSPAPNLSQVIHSAFDEADYNVLADTIDPDSRFEQEVKKSETFAMSQHLDAFNYFKQQAGIPTESESKYPKDLDELQLMENLGEFKTPIAKAIEKVCKHSYDISNWKEIQHKLIDDIKDFNKCCVKEYYDNEENKYKLQYVDITRLIAQYSDHRDYNDSCFYGEIKEHSIAEIRHKLEDAGYSENDISTAAYMWSGMWGGILNPAFDQWPNFQKTDQFSNWLYNFYKCFVLEVTWMENDIFFNAENTSNGRRKILPLEWGKVLDGYRNKTVNTTIKRRYEAKWIIGTDIIYDVQISPSQPKNKDNKRPLFPFHVYSGTETAITQRLIPVYDDIQIARLKFNNKLQELHDEILMVDITLLDRMVKPGDINGLLEILKQMKRVGFLPHRSLPIGGKYPGGNVTPLSKLPSSMKEVIEESIMLLENAFRQIELVTGINPIALGQQPQKDQGLGVTEIAINNTASALKPIINSIFNLKEKSAEFLAEGIRLAIRNDKKAYDAYAKVIGTNDTEALKKSEYEARQLGIKLIPKPSTQQIEHLYQTIEKMAQPGKDGKPLLTPDVQLYMEEKLMQGNNMTDIRLYVSNAINKERDRQDKMTQQNTQAQIDGLQKQEQVKNKGEMNKQQQKYDLEKRNADNQLLNDKDLESQKQNHEKYIKDQDMQMKQMELNANQNAEPANQPAEPAIAEQ